MIHGLRKFTLYMNQEIRHFMTEPLNHCLLLQPKSTKLLLQAQSHKLTKQKKTTTAKSHWGSSQSELDEDNMIAQTTGRAVAWV